MFLTLVYCSKAMRPRVLFGLTFIGSNISGIMISCSSAALGEKERGIQPVKSRL